MILRRFNRTRRNIPRQIKVGIHRMLPGAKCRQNRIDGTAAFARGLMRTGLKPRYRSGVGEEAERHTAPHRQQPIPRKSQQRAELSHRFRATVSLSLLPFPLFPLSLCLSVFLFLVFPTRPPLPSVSSFFLSPSFGLNNCDGPRVDINLRAIICLFSSSHSSIAARAFPPCFLPCTVKKKRKKRRRRKEYQIVSFLPPFRARVAHTARVKLLEFRGRPTSGL